MAITRPVFNTVDVRSAMYDNPAFADELAALYFSLCDERDAVYERAKPAEARLAEASAKVIAAQAEEAAAAREVEAVWGSNWVAQKKEIAQIAAAFVRIPKRK